ncbi:hypothetical protein R3P38DRAFT_2778335 [Favolaschia claudopus]|uniref:Uncharacterized protein n=1 Tax=Favolaschia claudopus TaxID=2862362 RepID=A0AAW0BKQ8_9AGAR
MPLTPALSSMRSPTLPSLLPPPTDDQVANAKARNHLQSRQHLGPMLLRAVASPVYRRSWCAADAAASAYEGGEVGVWVRSEEEKGDTTTAGCRAEMGFMTVDVAGGGRREVGEFGVQASISRMDVRRDAGDDDEGGSEVSYVLSVASAAIVSAHRALLDVILRGIRIGGYSTERKEDASVDEGISFTELRPPSVVVTRWRSGARWGARIACTLEGEEASVSAGGLAGTDALEAASGFTLQRPTCSSCNHSSAHSTAGSAPHTAPPLDGRCLFLVPVSDVAVSTAT